MEKGSEIVYPVKDQTQRSGTSLCLLSAVRDIIELAHFPKKCYFLEQENGEKQENTDSN